MSVVLPREGRYMPGASRFDWSEARRRLQNEPGKWVLPLDREISNGSVSWLRRHGPIALQDIRTEVEYRLRDSRVLDDVSTVVGTLYARWTPGQQAPVYVPGVMSDEEVVAARTSYDQGEATQQALATKYGVSLAGMNAILHGKVRAAAGGPVIGGAA